MGKPAAIPGFFSWEAWNRVRARLRDARDLGRRRLCRAKKPPSPTPVMPRPHPDSEQREAEGRALCKKDWDDLGAIEESIKHFYRKLKEAEAELARLESAPLDQRRRERAILAEKLNKARSRSTEPGFPPFPPCPARRPAHDRDIACEILRQGVIARWKREERARLERKKKADIAELQRQLAELDALIEDAPNKIARKKAEIADIRERLGHLAIGEKRVRDQYNARGCGRGAPYLRYPTVRPRQPTMPFTPSS
jgi:hypothetical protein